MSLKNQEMGPLRAKWNIAEDDLRANITACILNCQDRHFNRLAEETNALGLPSWKDQLYSSLREELRTHPLLDLCGIQPMTGPVGTIHWLDRKGSGMNISAHVRGQDIHAESRRTKAEPDEGESFVGHLLTEIAREIVGTMLMVCGGGRTAAVKPTDDIKLALTQAGNEIFKATKAGPANSVIGGKKLLERLGLPVTEKGDGIEEIGVVDGKWRVFYDKTFPEDKVLTWYQGSTVLDTGIVYSPYVLVEITPNFLDPDDGTLRRALRTRHKITVVSDGHFYALTL